MRKISASLMLFLFLVILVNPVQIANSQPSSNGDWIITDITLVENTTLIINGSILIQSGGALILRNSSLYMSLESDGQYRIEVFSGGNLTAIDSLITAYDPNNSYFIKANSGSKFLLNNSEVSYAGYSWGESSGIWINTDNATIRDSQIHYSYYTVYLDSCNGASIENNNMTFNGYGIRIDSCTDFTINDNFITNSTFPYPEYGIFAYLCDNFTIDNNTIANPYYGTGIYGGNCTDFVINNNEIGPNAHGIELFYCANGTVCNNDIAYNWVSGIHIDHCINLSMNDNDFTHCGLDIYGIGMVYFNHTIVGNIVNGKPLFYVFNQTNIIIEGGGQVVVAYSKDVVIWDSILSYTSVGVEVLYSNNTALDNNTIKNNGIGISMVSCDNVSLERNTIANNIGGGVFVRNCTNLFIQNNTIADVGVEIWYCINATINDNSFIRCGVFILYYPGISMAYYNHSIMDNTVNGKPLYYLFDQKDVIVEGGGQVIVILSQDVVIRNSNLSATAVGAEILCSSNITVSNSTLADNGAGIYSGSCSCVTVDNNNITNNYRGIHCLWDFNDSIVSHNTLTNNIYGIDMLHCFNVTIDNNTVESSDYRSVEMVECWNSTVEHNVVTNNEVGLTLESCGGICMGRGGYFIISSNEIRSSDGDGIFLQDCGGEYMGRIGEVIVRNNTIVDNGGNGIFMLLGESTVVKYNIVRNNTYGIFLEDSNNITTFLNDFVINSNQAYDDGPNSFDNGTIGNFWSDYTGNDSGGDGIGDTPYYIDGDSIDHYPLMYPIVAAELNPPNIEEVNRSLINPTNLDAVTVYTSVTDDTSISQVILGYYDQTLWTNVTMAYNSTSGYYEAKIPAFSVGTEIEYKVYAKDLYSNWAVSQSYNYTVSPETTPPEIIQVEQIPELPNDRLPVFVGVFVMDESGISQVILSFYNGTMWNNITMTHNYTSGQDEAQIPVLPAGTEVEYKIYVCDECGNWITSQSYFYAVVSSGGGMADLTLILIAGSSVVAVAIALTTVVLIRRRVH